MQRNTKCGGLDYRYMPNEARGQRIILRCQWFKDGAREDAESTRRCQGKITHRILRPSVSQQRPRTRSTHFLLIWYKKRLILTLTSPLKSESEAWFSNCACSRSSIRRSVMPIRFVMPRALLSTSRLKTPAFSDEMMTSILSNWRGENLSMDKRMPFS